MIRMLLVMLAAWASLLSGCFNASPSAAGGATETETGTAQVTGTVKWPDGRPAASARIRLRPVDFLAKPGPGQKPNGKSTQDTVADDKGRFALDSVPAGNYVLESLLPEGHGALVRFAIAKAAARAALGSIAMQPTGILVGTVRFSDSTLGPAAVTVYGLDRVAQADSATGRFTLADMPQGVFTLNASSSVAFAIAGDFPGITVEGRKTTDVGVLLLTKVLKQGFSVVDGKLILQGVTGGNPVFYDNDFCRNMIDNEFIWALASQGKLDLRGNLATPVRRDTIPINTEDFSEWTREARICRLAGMRNIPEPMLGATRKLSLPPSGKWEDIIPESNAGIRLLVSEARKASVEKPLLVLTGGALTSEADAVLLDPSIADKMVIFGVYNQSTNGRDSLANLIVAKRCRFIEFGRNYGWGGANPVSTRPLPTNWVGQRIRAFRDTADPAKFFTDLGPSAFLANPSAWKSAQSANFVAAPMTVTLGGLPPFDLIDIPPEANDWALMENEFFAAVTASETYHPWPVPGLIEAVSFRAMSGVVIDTLAGESETVRFPAEGDWAEFALESAASGAFDLVLEYKSDSSAQTRITGPDGALGPQLTLAPGSAWSEIRTRIQLAKGVQVVRLTGALGTWRLGRIRIEIP